jgi:hypothetical protein
MTLVPIDNSQRTAAKVAGIAGLFTMGIVVFANYGLLNPLIVPGNAAETARNIVAHERAFRVTVICQRNNRRTIRRWPSSKWS